MLSRWQTPNVCVCVGGGEGVSTATGTGTLWGVASRMRPEVISLDLCMPLQGA